MKDYHVKLAYLNKLEAICSNYITHSTRCPVLQAANPSVVDCRCGARETADLAAEAIAFLRDNL